MEHKSSEKAKPETRKVRLSSDPPKIQRVFLAGNSNGCMLVIPEVFGMHEHITLYQGRLPDYYL